ncbi:peptidase M16-like protein [Candidatus Koribacter versatilis Ellin345]|uniref:Peptidase M16-like protein n=1 Tax=Koribacter versatilis (strain Ellin345) TaxID=204669 RepID=Q1IRD0_KORVE|nr:pitrilysin family protein [Candidatus Koribacter versatilis]ABF40570.1 peptidase M16-like protein [Candidatus Koribacter versatilis Ellin345]
MASALRNVRKEVLPNGLTVLTEEMDHIRSVSIGIWVKNGSRHEDPQVNGISHFIEHMVFKGTTTRNAEAIAREVDSIGGNMDAFTGKEMVCFNVKILDEHVPVAMDVLSDMVLNPVFDGAEIDREKGVIQEEIKMDEDNPDYLVHEIFTQNFYKDHPLGKPILGTKETVKGFDRDIVLGNYGRKFAPGNLIVAAAGNINHKSFVDEVRRRFEHLKPSLNGFHQEPPKTHARIIMRNKKSLEQVQICLGVPAYSISDKRRYVCYILNTLLGGGMSSRLFQDIREKQGLVYSIFSELNPFQDSGSLAVYAGTSRESAPKVVTQVVKEFGNFKREMVSVEELQRAKAQLKGSLMLGLESSTARMSNLARQEMYYDHFHTMDEIIAKIEVVTREEVCEMANEIFRAEDIAVTVLGNMNGVKISRDQLAC